MSDWVRQLLYVRRDARGHIVGISEARPNTYKEPEESVLKPPRKKRKDAKEQKKAGLAPAPLTCTLPCTSNLHVLIYHGNGIYSILKVRKLARNQEDST